MTVKRGIENSSSSNGFSSCFCASKFCTSRKGQVTIFIIIGIVILFTFAGILYLTKTITTEKITTEGDPIIRDVPHEFKPIRLYTENCLEQIGKKGLLLLGGQGGYIYPELLGEFSVSKPTEGSGLNLEPVKVPYWHYNTERNDVNKVVLSSLQPKLYAKDDPKMSIEAQLARFVREKLSVCLDDYSAFRLYGFDVAAGEEKKVTVTVGESTVNFLLEMEVNAEKESVEAEFDKFFVKIPLELKHYYEVADKIASSQKEFSFLERQGMELISVFSGKDPLHFPPVSDVTYDFFSTLSWDETSLRQKLKEVLISYVPMLRFLGSENFYYSPFYYSSTSGGNLLAQKMVDNMVLPLTGAEDLIINFDYFGWEPYFKANSDESGKIQPEHTFVNLGPLSFGTQRYETHYDASYPVMVTVKDDNAFSGDGYSLVFAMESNIRNNAPAVHEQVRETYPRKISSLACREEQRDTGLLKTIVIDSFSKEPIEMVRVGFTIPELDECSIGITDSWGEVEGNYPTVYGGVVNFLHTDYLTNFYPVDTYKYKDESALLGYAVEGAESKVIEMDRIVTRNVAVAVKDFKKCVQPLKCKYTESPAESFVFRLGFLPYSDISCETGEEQCFFSSASGLFGFGSPEIEMEINGSLSRYNDYHFIDKARKLNDNEEVFLNLERVKGFRDDVVSGDFSAVVSIKGNNVGEVQLVPGIYKVSGMVTLNEEIVIPSEQRCFQYDIIGWEEEECVSFDESRMGSYVTGNVDWSTPETYIMIKPEDLYTASEITFYLPSQDIFSVPEKIMTTAEVCDGYSCITGTGCLFEGCEEKDVAAPGRLVDDLQVPGLIGEIAKKPEIRRAFNPTFRSKEENRR